MLSRVWSAALLGIDALPIEIETHVEPGLPRWTVVGLPDGAVRESRDRVWAALKNSDLPVPRGAVTVNLAPADVRKEGSAFDLPLAIGLLGATGMAFDRLEDYTILGELSLDGSLRPVRGVLSAALRARADGKKAILLPPDNAKEASVVDGMLWAFVGCGVNCAHHPDGTPYPATDLATAGFETSPEVLFRRFDAELNDAIERWDRGRAFAPFRAAWLDRAHGLGTTTMVRTPVGERSGVLAGMDEDGRLMLRGPAGTEAIAAGDVLPHAQDE